MRVIPAVSNSRFYKQRLIDFAAVLHDVDDFFLGSVEVFLGDFEDEFIVLCPLLQRHLPKNWHTARGAI